MDVNHFTAPAADPVDAFAATGATLLIVESDSLTAHQRGIW